MVRDPSFPLIPEFRRNNRLPWARSFALCRSRLYPPYPVVTIESNSATVAISLVVFDERLNRERNKLR